MTVRESSRVVSPMFVGRAAELRALVAAVTAPPSVAVVVGEAGIGKTRLVAELAGHEAGRQPHVPLGSALEQAVAGDIPHGCRRPLCWRQSGGSAFRCCSIA
jgi:MoxR-like ATPase